MIRTAIIGCGSIARQRHAREYLQNQNAELIGVYDLSPERAAEMAALFKTSVFHSTEELMADPRVDAVSICAANAYHADLTIRALNAGKHVLCEKPMATTLADCEAMVAAAKANHRRLMIGQNQRLTPAHKKAKELIASGQLGRVLSFRSAFGHKGPELWSIDKSANTWFFRKNAAAFGSMADLGIHKLDLMRYLIGSRVSSVYAELRVLDKKFPDGTPIEVDDNSIEILSFDNGAMGTVTTSWTHYGEECNASTLYCERGILKLYEDPRYSLDLVNADGTRVHYELDRIQTNDDKQQASSGVIDTFIRALETGEPCELDADDILESMRAVFACIRSSEEGRRIEL